MPFWRGKKRVEGKTPSNSQHETEREEMFSTAGDYGLRTLAEGDKDIIEYVGNRDG
jgi:hypothetical protein